MMLPVDTKMLKILPGYQQKFLYICRFFSEVYKIHTYQQLENVVTDSSIFSLQMS